MWFSACSLVNYEVAKAIVKLELGGVFSDKQCWWIDNDILMLFSKIRGDLLPFFSVMYALLHWWELLLNIAKDWNSQQEVQVRLYKTVQWKVIPVWQNLRQCFFFFLFLLLALYIATERGCSYCGHLRHQSPSVSIKSPPTCCTNLCKAASQKRDVLKRESKNSLFQAMDELGACTNDLHK